MRSKLVVSSVLALLSLTACGGAEMMPPPAGACGAAGRSGQTDCSGVTTCNAGQYCDDSGFPTCTPGCTSDTNCGPNEFCARPVGEAIGACQACPVCGNGACEGGESAASCAADCAVSGPVCGNGACEAGESAATCAPDCSAAGPVCGNGVCEAGESMATCAGDCPDETLAACLEHCQAYNFFECFEPGGLAACRTACEGATMADREQFDVCAASGAVSCDEACFEFLP